MEKVRLHKYMSQCGIASRRTSEKLIAAGKVTVNGKVAAVGMSVDPSKDKVEVQGKSAESREQKVYYAVNKPRGYVSSCSDTGGKVVTELVKSAEKLYPVGRLDKDSEGLMILTNDGELANKLTHPKFGCEKEYTVVLDRDIPNAEIERLASGVMMDGKMTAPCIIEKLSEKRYLFILKEGKKRQIRRMAQDAGAKVLRLKRVRIKKLLLGDLRHGQSRRLTGREIAQLKA